MHLPFVFLSFNILLKFMVFELSVHSGVANLVQNVLILSTLLADTNFFEGLDWWSRACLINTFCKCINWLCLSLGLLLHLVGMP